MKKNYLNSKIFSVIFLITITLFPKHLISFLPKIYQARLSNSWYPENRAQLSQTIKNYFDIASKYFDAKIDPSSIRAMIVPHAGYEFSGICAASCFRKLLLRDDYRKLMKNYLIQRVIVIGPSHTVPFVGVALPNFETFRTPLGDIDIDTESIENLLDDKLFKVMPEVFEPEHSVEIELPFLQEVLGTFKLVPLIVGDLSPEQINKVANSLSEIIDSSTLVVISSDFTHHGPIYDYIKFKENIVDKIKRLDSDAIEIIFDKSKDRFLRFIKNVKPTICGRIPIAILLTLIRKGVFGEVSARLMNYYTSAHIQYASNQGNRFLVGNIPDKFIDNIVSYAGVIFTNESLESLHPNMRLTDYEKHALLRSARESIENKFSFIQIPENLIWPIKTPALSQTSGAFVTLNTHDGELRGCIGNIQTNAPLYKTVDSVAKSAAFNDTRFSPVKKSELDKLIIDISILSSPKKIPSYKNIRLGRHGIILEKKYETGEIRQAVFLPQVPKEFGWDLKTTLENLSEKAALPKDAWKNANFRVFEGYEIKEK